MVSPPHRSFRFLIRTLAAAWLACAAPGEAAVDPALQAEYDRAFAATYAAPGDLDLALKYAEVATRIGDFEGAIGALERMLIYNPDLPRIRLELGALYLRLQSYEIARTYLSELPQAALPEAKRARARQMLTEIEARVATHRFTGILQTGLRYQSNVGSSPSSGVIRAYGLDSSLDQQYAKRSDGSFFLSGGVSHVYDPGWESGTVWESNLVGYANRQFAVTKFHLLLGEFDTGPRFELAGKGTEAVTLRPYALAGAVGLADSLYYTSLGGGASLTVPLGADLSSDIAAEARDRSFHASTRFSSADDKTGLLLTSRARLRYTPAPDHQLTLTGVVSRDKADDPAEANWEWGIGLEHQWLLPASLGPTALPPRLITGVQRVWRDYDEADAFVDPGVTRRDRQWLVGATLLVPVAPAWNLLLQAQQDWTSSNLSNYRYNSASGLVGLSYVF